MTKRQSALYWNLWKKVCQAKSWRQADSAARHAVHLMALEYDKSHLTLSNAELDRVLAQFRLLIDPDNLRATLDLQDPDRGTRKRLEWALKRFPPALVQDLLRDKFDRASLSSLDTAELQQLLMTLKRITRRHAPHAPHAAPALPPLPAGEGRGEGERLLQPSAPDAPSAPDPF